MNWDENKHPRDEIGRFTYSDGSGGEHIPTDAEKERLRELGLDNKPQLSKQEWAILRAEVMRKNAAQKGKAKPVNCAFTANYFYVYKTNGYDDFIVLKSFDIERDGDFIDEFLMEFGE